MLSILCVLTSWLALTSGQSAQSNATLSSIEILPCAGTTFENVSLYKSDIYTVVNNVSLCGDRWNPNTTNGFRVFTSAEVGDNLTHTPVVFVARQQQDGIVSWNIPLQPLGFSIVFYEVNRTVCPISPNRAGNKDTPLLYIDVFSSSPNPINYTISIEALQNFEIFVGPADQEEAYYLLEAGAAAPQILYVKFPEDSEVLTILAETEDNKCAFISIQNNSCPVNDLLNTARSLGIFQTMSTTAFLTVKASEVNDREFLIIIITTNFSVCHSDGFQPQTPLDPINSTDRFEQSLALKVERLPPISKFGWAIAMPVLVYLAVWAIGLTVPFFCLPQVRWTPPFGCSWVKSKKPDEQLLPEGSPNHSYSTPLEGKNRSVSSDSGSEDEGKNRARQRKGYDESLEISAKIEMDESKLKVPRMCKQRHSKMKDAYSVYGWNTVTVGIFYALPAFQLVLSEQQILNASGNQDQCYYNFKCAYPVWVFSAFNNIFSNIGYVMLGILFIVVVWIRNIQYNKRRERDCQYADTHGVPQFFGIYYAMGIALITEGFMSAFYHICPTNANFQFDTAFMFIIGGLFLVKVFQNRHPDIHANAFIAFFSFAVVIFFTLIGIVFDRANPVVVRLVMFFLVLGLVIIFFVSFYHFHTWNLKNAILEIFRNIKSCRSGIMHKGRFVKLVIAFGINLLLVILVVVMHDSLDIATSVLAFFLVNLLYFIVLYTLQKLWYKEPVTILPLILPVFIAILWATAFVFFFQNVSNWKLTPAESRQLNRECIVLGFYDNHDIWHFLSASAMFFSFLFMLVLDDGVADVKREDLHIF